MIGSLDRLSRALRSVCALTSAVAAACSDSPQSTVYVGTVAVPEATVASLQEPERQMLFDLVALGSIVALDEVATFSEPYVSRVIGDSLVVNLPAFLGARRMGIDEARLRAIYDQDPEWELVVRHVIRLADDTMSAATRNSQRAVAEEVARLANAGEDFAALAARYSQEPGAPERGGLLQPGRSGTWVEPFWLAASQLLPGQVSGVVESPFGYHVLKLDDRRPVPFEEVALSDLLRRMVPLQEATVAMEEWIESQPAPRIDPVAVDSARQLLLAGGTVPEGLVLVTAEGSATYTGLDLAAGWQRLSSEERLVMERADAAAFTAWLESDARQVLWAQAAAELGVRVRELVAIDAVNRWDATAIALGRVFGFLPGASDLQIQQAAMQALLSGAPESRSARTELRGLRPRLRQIYPVSTSAAVP